MKTNDVLGKYRLMKNLLLLLFMSSFLGAYAQEDSTRKDLEEVILFANKFAEKQRFLAQKIELITSRVIDHTNAQNTGDLLVNTGKVFVQKSQQGGSSPVLRGFEASRVLLVVDGIRMNNAIYRSGHLQNIITVDQNMLERVEVLFGPASTLYGSDALGGVIQMFTKRPLLSGNQSFITKHQAFTRYSSANNEKTVHYNGTLGGKKLGWLQSYTFSDFGDMKMGSRYPEKYPDFGRRSQYIDHINGVDTILANPDDRVQKFSGYTQWDITQKLLYKPSARFSHLLNLQHSNTNNVPRYDRLQDRRNGQLRYSEWYYGPQTRWMAAYEFNAFNPVFFEEIKAIASYQHIKESRHTRAYRRYEALDQRYEKLDVLGIAIDGRKRWVKHELTVGMDAQLNDVRSTAHRTNTIDRTRTPLDSRYPDGKNKMNYFAIYTQHLLKIIPEKLILNDGIRLQSVHLHSTIKDNSFFQLPFTEIKQDNVAVTGNIGLVYIPHKKYRIALNVASGFRAPNIDDLSKIFESNATDLQLVVPNPGIKPEYTYNVDLSLEAGFENLKLNATLFYTWFQNAIALAPYNLNGKDSLEYNGQMSALFANQNVNKAFIYGAQASLQANLTPYLTASASAGYTYGRFKDKSGYTTPADHIPPVYGKVGMEYIKEKFQLDLHTIFNGWKHIEDYHAGGEDNQQYATADGMPAWYIINLKGSYKVSEHFRLQAGVENILDRNYRYFASGFSAAGRNVYIALRADF